MLRCSSFESAAQMNKSTADGKVNVQLLLQAGSENLNKFDVINSELSPIVLIINLFSLISAGLENQAL